jgi:hypothetical protein
VQIYHEQEIRAKHRRIALLRTPVAVPEPGYWWHRRSKRRLASAHWLVALGILSLPLSIPLLGEEPTVTVWLMPSEPADEQQIPARTSVDQQVDEFCRQFPHLTIFNATDPYLRAQLIAWSPEFALAAWPMLKGQRHTLEALERFAQVHHAHVNFRLESWAKAFGDLQSRKALPDVAQIGSTWAASLAGAGELSPGSPGDGLRWRTTPALKQASLYYTTDVRLIFYWRRPLNSNPDAPAFDPTSDSWQSFLDSLRQYVEATASKPMALPIGVTQNLLHDYATLVWAGGGDILESNRWRTYTDLTSASALAVPLKLATAAVVTRGGQPYRLLAFPEMDHEEATRHFMAGEYVAVFEPVAFIRRWHDSFVQREPKPTTPPDRLAREKEFWTYAGVLALPGTFKGGSDLVVLNTSVAPTLAFSLARFLTEDAAFSGLMGGIGWLPAHRGDFGLSDLKSSLCHDSFWAGPCSTPPDGLVKFERTLREALEKGREYPQYANWPESFEARSTLDQFQNLWRAIGEGDEKGIRAAADAVQSGINRKIDRRTRALEQGKQVWLPLAIFAVLLSLPLVAYEIRRGRRVARTERARAEEEQEKNVALSLVVAEDHGRMRAQVWALQSLEENCSDSETLRASFQLHIGNVSRYGELLKTLTTKLCLELAGERVPVTTMEIAKQAFEVAKVDYAASFPKNQMPEMDLDCSPSLMQWGLTRSPSLLVLILSEWFFNCLKEPTDTAAHISLIKILVRQTPARASELVIVSPTVIAPERARVFERNGATRAHSPGRGISLMRDLLWYGFKATAHCEPRPQQKCTALTIRIDLEPKLL